MKINLQPSNRLGWTVMAALAALVIVVSTVTAITLGGGEDPVDATTTDTEPAGNLPVLVLYEVEGEAEWADVTLTTPSGTIQVSPDVPMTQKSGEPGLAYEFPAGSFVSISAQNNDGYGSISCRITVDGVVVSENESDGAYAIASCDAVTGR